jgi:hypothetical protein
VVFFDSFLFQVKVLGLLTNPGHYIRVYDVVGSYIYIYIYIGFPGLGFH